MLLMTVPEVYSIVAAGQKNRGIVADWSGCLLHRCHWPEGAAAFLRTTAVGGMASILLSSAQEPGKAAVSKRLSSAVAGIQRPARGSRTIVPATPGSSISLQLANGGRDPDMTLPGVNCHPLGGSAFLLLT